MKKNVIITFANQKGGVGKSTLCAMFAHYLTLAGVKVQVVDADRQQSLTQLRNLNQKAGQMKDQNAAAEESAARKPDKRYVNLLPAGHSWSIQQAAIRDAAQTDELMRQLKTFEGVVLIDSQGSLTENGMIPLVVMSDFIFCPFFYEMPTLFSTSSFLGFIEKIRARYPKMTAQTILIPNKFKSSVGRANEKGLIDRTILALRRFGLVAPEIKDIGRIQFYSTLEFNLIQKDACSPTYDYILKETGLETLFAEWIAAQETTTVQN